MSMMVAQTFLSEQAEHHRQTGMSVLPVLSEQADHHGQTGMSVLPVIIDNDTTTERV